MVAKRRAQTFLRLKMECKTRIFYSECTKLRILHLHEQVYHLPTIHKLLREGGEKFLKWFYATGKGKCLFACIIMLPAVQGTISTQAGSGRRTVITDDIRRIVEE